MLNIAFQNIIKVKQYFSKLQWIPSGEMQAREQYWRGLGLRCLSVWNICDRVCPTCRESFPFLLISIDQIIQLSVSLLVMYNVSPNQIF